MQQRGRCSPLCQVDGAKSVIAVGRPAASGRIDGRQSLPPQNLSETVAPTNYLNKNHEIVRLAATNTDL